MEQSVFIAPKTHLRKCEVCKAAKTSDEMCRDMQTYLDGDSATYQNEIPIDPIKALYLAEKFFANETEPPADEIEELIEDLNFGALTLRQQQCLRLYFFEGFTEDAIAESLKVSQPTVNREIHNALNTLRANFEDSVNDISISRREKIKIAKIFLVIMKNYRKIFSLSDRLGCSRG